jgi:SAM-dependent methyltransferase
LKGRSAPIVLEVGVSGFSRLYKKLFPHIRFVMVDRPVAAGGAGGSYGFDECSAERFYNIDLNTHPLDPTWGNPPLGTFDYVIFAEVLEHLTVSPVQLFQELLDLLKPNGYLYLTTPNFFSLYHLQQFMQGENPQCIFPRRGENKHAGHHFREYGMTELVHFMEDIGGKIVKTEYSDCWEDEHSRQVIADHPEWRRELVIVARRADATAHTDSSPKPSESSMVPLPTVDFQLLGEKAFGGVIAKISEIITELCMNPFPLDEIAEIIADLAA